MALRPAELRYLKFEPCDWIGDIAHFPLVPKPRGWGRYNGLGEPDKTKRDAFVLAHSSGTPTSQLVWMDLGWGSGLKFWEINLEISKIENIKKSYLRFLDPIPTSEAHISV